MPDYNDLRPEADFRERDYALVFPGMTLAEKRRCIEGLLRLKIGLGSLVASRRTESNLLIASWNIVKFGASKQRLPESYYYLAEIIAAFDLVAVQEVRTSLRELELVMRILGDDWRYMVNDVTGGPSGNHERSAYIYNTRRVELSGLAAEIALWKEIRGPGALIEQIQRAPFVTGFRAGWKEFAMVNLHLQPGDRQADVRLRMEEVRLLLAALDHKAREVWTENLVLVGDMNLYFDADIATVAAIEAAGFRENEGAKDRPTNVGGTEAYDRMFFREGAYFSFETQEGRESGGVFDPFPFVFRDEDWRHYRARMAADHGTPAKAAAIPHDDGLAQSYYRHPWRKNQISDHLPMWVELRTDDSARFLSNNLDALGA